MAAIPEVADPTLAAVATQFEIAGNEPARPHLGASQIGQPCVRRLWYGFRWLVTEAFYASTLARFADGHHSEDVMAARLRLVPEVDLATHSADGKQYRFSDHGGHFGGSADGFIRGLLQAPKTPHVWEHKCVNDAKFKKLDKLKEERGEKQALLHWDEIYHAQAQVYMHYFGMTRHYLTCATPGTRDVTSVRTDYSKAFAESLVAKAGQIIASDSPPTRITERKDDYRCKFCPYIQQCHYGAIASEHCRTCRHSRPVDGGWWCSRHSQMLTIDQQRQGCGDFQPLDGVITMTDAA